MIRTNIFKDAEDFAESFGSGFMQDGTFHIQVPSENGIRYYDYRPFGDASISVNVRIVSASPTSQACVLARVVVENDSDVSLCYDGGGTVYAGRSSGEDYEELFSTRPNMGNVYAWHALKIISHGNSFRFYVDSVLVGSSEVAASSAGYAGVSVFNPDSGDAIEYEFWNLIVRSVNEAGASVPPTSTAAASSAPSLGSVLYNVPLSEWRSEADAVGWTETSASSLLMGIYGGNGQRVREAWTAENGWSNISATVEVREISRQADGEACVSLRHDAFAGDYSWCLLSNQDTKATYSWIDEAGVWQSETLVAQEHRSGVKPVSGWNALTISARGNQLWFYVNGDLLATTLHSSRSTGDVAIAVVGRDASQNVEWEFRNLVVHEVRQ